MTESGADRLVRESVVTPIYFAPEQLRRAADSPPAPSPDPLFCDRLPGYLDDLAILCGQPGLQPPCADQHTEMMAPATLVTGNDQ